MTTTTPDEPAAELPIESLRRLARGLLFERSSADDLVQDAWLAALERRGEIERLGGWLAGTVRRLARNRAREEGRRTRRESGVARAEAEPSALEASARIEILQRLLAAVNRLDAPQREAVVLRYFDDLPPRAIAVRLGVPVNTARTRVRRGIERLRADLDTGDERDREAFLSALVPLLRTETKLLPDLARSAWSNYPLAYVVLVLVLGTLTWLVARSNEPVPAQGRAVALAPELDGNAPAEPVQSPVSPRDPANGAKSTASAGRAPITNAWTVRGHVNRGNLESHPAARLVGRVFAGTTREGALLLEERFQADAKGDFAWSLAQPSGLFLVVVEGDMPDCRGRAVRSVFLPGDAAPEDWHLLLFPLDCTVRGTVHGPAGEPLAGAYVGDSFGDEGRAVRTGSDGTFVLACASALTSSVIAWLPGFSPGYARFQPTPGSEVRAEIALGPEMRLHGSVHDGSGQPIAGAAVFQVMPGFPATSDGSADPSGFVVTQQGFPLFRGAWPKVISDADGRYELGGIHPRSMSILLGANATGFRPTEEYCPEPGMLSEHERDLTLERGLTLAGRVRAGNEPVEAAWISAGDAPNKLEGVKAWSDADGRFRLENLPAGAQHLWIWRRGFAWSRHDVNAYEGMPELELELQPGHSVGGVVLGPDGAPLPWSLIMASDANSANPPLYPGASTSTNGEGRFHFAELPAGRVALSTGAPGCEWLSQEVALDRDDLVLRLAPKLVARPKPSGPRPSPPAEPVVPVTATTGGGVVRGLLLDSAGNPRGQEMVELVPAKGAKDGRRAVTNERGEFTLAGLPPGTFDARWVRREAELEALDLETRLTLAADETRELELRPKGRAVLRGTIEFRERLPAEPAEKSQVTKTIGFGTMPVREIPPGGVPTLITVQLVPLVDHAFAPSGRRGAFAHAGRFEFDGLQPGEWSVQVQLVFPGNYRISSSKQVRLEEDGELEIVLPL